MTDQEIKELEKAYAQTSKGANLPGVSLLRCDECRVTFMLTKSYHDELCTHLRDYLAQFTRPR